MRQLHRIRDGILLDELAKWVEAGCPPPPAPDPPPPKTEQSGTEEQPERTPAVE